MGHKHTPNRCVRSIERAHTSCICTVDRRRGAENPLVPLHGHCVHTMLRCTPTHGITWLATYCKYAPYTTCSNTVVMRWPVVPHSHSTIDQQYALPYCDHIPPMTAYVVSTDGAQTCTQQLDPLLPPLTWPIWRHACLTRGERGEGMVPRIVNLRLLMNKVRGRCVHWTR